MPCGYQCYEVGGPWIAENPDCPVHGQGGTEDEMEQMRSRIEELEKRVARLEQQPHSSVGQSG